MPKKYFVVTYGCQMNKADGEAISASLKKDGYKPAAKLEKADLVVVNMCSVRQSAVDRIFGLANKLKGSSAKTILTGCILKKDERKFREIFDDVKRHPWFSYSVNARSKYIPISNGCNNFCTYCVVPHTRGRLVCRDCRTILKEVKNALKNGAKEIWLVGQNVNDYKSGVVNFAKLLKKVNNVPGDFQVRFTSPNPADFSDELIEAVAKCQKVAKYLNLPIQSGDDEILRKMNRRYTVKQYRNLVQKIRKNIPGVNLSTDVIVGFPGETKKQFNNTLNLFKEMKFNIAFISKYSPRPGTPAFQLTDNVPWPEKKRRERILMNLLAKKDANI